MKSIMSYYSFELYAKEGALALKGQPTTRIPLIQSRAKMMVLMAITKKIEENSENGIIQNIDKAVVTHELSTNCTNHTEAEGYSDIHVASTGIAENPDDILILHSATTTRSLTFEEEGLCNNRYFGGGKSSLFLCVGNSKLAQHSGGFLVVQTFYEEQAVAITKANAAISCSSVISDLAYVRDLPLVKAVKIMRGIKENLNQASGSVGTAIVDKFNKVLQQNPGWKVIADILEGQTTSLPELKKEVNIDDLGIQLHRGPKHPKYSTPESRLLTYSHWPRQLTRQTPETLVQAGFYYIGLSDQVRCFHCDGGLSSWDPTDDPFVEHARWFPHCGYITLVRGTQFVKDMLEEHPPVLASSNIGLNRTETNEANQNQVDIIDESSQSLAELVDTVLDIQSNSSQQDTSKVESRDMSQSMSTLHEKNSLATSQDEDEYHSISAVSTRSLELLPAQITYSSQVHKVSTYSGTLLPEVMSTNNPPVLSPGTSTCASKNGLDLDAKASSACLACPDATPLVGYRGSEPALAWRDSGKPLRKTTPSSPERDSNLNLLILGSLAQHETSALANYATEFLALPMKHRKEVTMYHFSWGVLFSASPLAYCLGRYQLSAAGQISQHSKLPPTALGQSVVLSMVAVDPTANTSWSSYASLRDGAEVPPSTPSCSKLGIIQRKPALKKELEDRLDHEDLVAFLQKCEAILQNDTLRELTTKVKDKLSQDAVQWWRYYGRYSNTWEEVCKRIKGHRPQEAHISWTALVNRQQGLISVLVHTKAGMTNSAGDISQTYPQSHFKPLLKHFESLLNSSASQNFKRTSTLNPHKQETIFAELISATKQRKKYEFEKPTLNYMVTLSSPKESYPNRNQLKLYKNNQPKEGDTNFINSLELSNDESLSLELQTSLALSLPTRSEANHNQRKGIKSVPVLSDLHYIIISHHVVEEGTPLHEVTGDPGVLGVLLTTASPRKTSLHEETGGSGVLSVLLTAAPPRKTSLHEGTGGPVVLGMLLIATPPRKTSLHEGTGGHAVLGVVLTTAPPSKTPLYKGTGGHGVLDMVLSAAPPRNILSGFLSIEATSI
uniref:(California timema) hypothetical protein n=1 Tax=Timema californicum TaxID=61474 RepID=A0A7R9P9Y8_TIMCA|nr:unnamed protein product [Timema californicum]